MTTGQTTDEPRCSCGYLLQGLTEKRCPECGRSFPGKPRRKKPYLLWGFLVGFLLVAVPMLVWIGPFLCWARGADGQFYGLIVLLGAGVGLAIGVVTGLIGMLIGYVVYRIRR